MFVKFFLHFKERIFSILFYRNRSFALGTTAIISLVLTVIPVAVLLVAGIFLFTKKKVKGSKFNDSNNGNNRTITNGQNYNSQSKNNVNNNAKNAEQLNANPDAGKNTLSKNGTNERSNSCLINLDDNNAQKQVNVVNISN